MAKAYGITIALAIISYKNCLINTPTQMVVLRQVRLRTSI
jgi:hypothetical protein